MVVLGRISWISCDLLSLMGMDLNFGCRRDVVVTGEGGGVRVMAANRYVLLCASLCAYLCSLCASLCIFWVRCILTLRAFAVHLCAFSAASLCIFVPPSRCIFVHFLLLCCASLCRLRWPSLCAVAASPSSPSRRRPSLAFLPR
jgi:hypothetical protein